MRDLTFLLWVGLAALIAAAVALLTYEWVKWRDNIRGGTISEIIYLWPKWAKLVLAAIMALIAFSILFLIPHFLFELP